MASIQESIEALTKHRLYNTRSKTPRPTEANSSTASANILDVASSDEGELINAQLKQPVRKRARDDDNNGVNFDAMTDEEILRRTRAIQTRAAFLEANNALKKAEMVAEALTMDGEGSNQDSLMGNCRSHTATQSSLTSRGMSTDGTWGSRTT